MTAPAPSPTGPATRGESTLTWALWGLLLLAMLITYTRLDPAQLYHVTRDGLTGGLSRALVAVNFPVALIAIALVLVALDALPRRAWWWGGPALALSAVTTVPGVVDDQDLDARLINAVPALGVALAVGLGIVAGRRARTGVERHLPLDPLRWFLAGAALLLSIPWIFADLGVYAPEWVFIMERPIVGSDGVVNPAVHLGHHHGLDGALFVVSAALLSRPRLRSRGLSIAVTAYVSLLFAYGLVNFGQDVWNEQLWKRGWVDRSIPSAYNPALDPIWLVILLIAAVTVVGLRLEQRHVADANSRRRIRQATGSGCRLIQTVGVRPGRHRGSRRRCATR